MSYKGKIYGAPMNVSQVGLFYNKALIEKAGIKPADFADWDGFLAAVKKVKAAGIVPISAGGADKWPLNMFWECLAVRIGGRAAFESAYSRKGPGFDGPDFLKTAEDFKQLIDLDPFQKGFLGASAPQAAGYFGDGNAAFHLMGNWAYNTQRTESVSKQGLGDNLAYTTFPTVKGGKGEPDDTISGINGYLVTKGAPPEAVELLKFFTNLENQAAAAKAGFFIPVAKGAEAGMANPVFKQIAINLSKSNYIQNFYDQMLGPSVGRVVNDTSADLAAGKMSPKQVGQAIQDAWAMEQ
jgi:raffinose/stachyose/melibiose transport system substrate-binding protein